MRKIIIGIAMLLTLIIAFTLALLLAKPAVKTTVTVVKPIATPSATLTPQIKSGGVISMPTTQPAGQSAQPNTTEQSTTVINQQPQQNNPTPTAQPTPTPFLNIPLPTIKVGGLTL